MSTPAPILAWSGTARSGGVAIQAPDGQLLTFSALAPLADHLRGRGDPFGGAVQCAAMLGAALHAIERVHADGSDPGDALAQALALLRGLPVQEPIARLNACLDKHRDLLAKQELAARLVLEAKRMQREHAEAVTLAGAAARSVIPATGTILLAWPGGPGCDLGDGLLTGALAAARRGGGAGAVLVAGPPALAGDACRFLAGRGITASAAPDAQAATAQGGRPPAAVLVRCDGDGGLAEPAAAALAHDAARNGVAVVAIGLRARPGAQSAGLAPLPTQRTRLFLHPAAP